MHLSVESVFEFITLVVFLGILLLVYWSCMTNLRYWKDRGVPYMASDCIFGSVADQILRKSSWNEHSESCYGFLKGNGFGGAFLFRTPIMMICDPHLIEKVLVQDFAYFHDRGNVDLNEPLTKTLFNAKGGKWRLMRHSLAPSFTSLKIKGMLGQTLKCSDYVLNKIKETINTSNSLEMDSVVFVYAVEVIASCAFGVQLLADGKEAKNFKETINVMYDTNPMRTVRYLLTLICPKVFKLLGLSQIAQPVTDFFVNLTKATIAYRIQNNIVRNDFLQLMIHLKDQGKRVLLPDILDSFSEGNKMIDIESPEFSNPSELSFEQLITEDEIAALLFNFITAGLRPSAGTISFALFEVAKNVIIQKKVHEDIDCAINKHKTWNYEALKEMTYLDQVIQETLRMYNFNSFLAREVTKPYQLPGTALTLEKGMLVFIPLAGLHADPHHYPLPHVFDPERFSGNNYKPNPFFMPFGNGPRICIAVRFAVLTIKVCLARVLSQYSVGISSEMRTPLDLDKNEFYPKAKDGIWLTFAERKQS